MFIYEAPGIHGESNKEFVVRYEALPIGRPYWRHITRWRPWERWLVECIVEFDGTSYHDFKHDFPARSLHSAIREVYDRGDEVWLEVIDSPTSDWW